jgi:DNA polymerase III delta subunit
VIIERVFSCGKNIFAAIEPYLSEWQKTEAALFVFWDADCGESEAIARVKKYAAKTQEFKILSGRQLERWLDNEVSARRIKLSPPIKRLLIAAPAGDLWRLTGELEKYELGGSLAVSEKLNDTKIWNFTDAFVASKKKALAASFCLASEGYDLLYLMAALGKSLRAILAARDALERKIPLAEVGKKMGLRNSFVLRKQAETARALAMATLIKNYRLLFSTDENIKTGKLPASIAFLNLFVK